MLHQTLCINPFLTQWSNNEGHLLLAVEINYGAWPHVSATPGCVYSKVLALPRRQCSPAFSCVLRTALGAPFWAGDGDRAAGCLTPAASPGILLVG